jgi:hypothetical protein
MLPGSDAHPSSILCSIAWLRIFTNSLLRDHLYRAMREMTSSVVVFQLPEENEMKLIPSGLG